MASIMIVMINILDCGLVTINWLPEQLLVKIKTPKLNKSGMTLTEDLYKSQTIDKRVYE